MDSLPRRSIVLKNVWEFNKACGLYRSITELYKSMLDKNFGNRFCTDGHCKRIFMVEIRLDDSKWGATPKMFYNKEKAEAEAEALRLKYPFILEYRVITRQIEEKAGCMVVTRKREEKI